MPSLDYGSSAHDEALRLPLLGGNVSLLETQTDMLYLFRVISLNEMHFVVVVVVVSFAVTALGKASLPSSCASLGFSFVPS